MNFLLLNHSVQSNQNALSLREELKAITPQLEEMQKRKNDRLSQFLQVIEQIRKISTEVWPNGRAQYKMNVDESDLSTRKLEEFQRQLEALQNEKVCSYFRQKWKKKMIAFGSSNHLIFIPSQYNELL